MKVSEVMTRGLAAVTPKSSLAEAAKLMRDHDIGAVPVVDGARVVGMLTDRDIVVRAVAEGKADAPVGKVMSSVVIGIEPDEDVKVAAKIMAREKIRRLPVVRNGELLGIVSLGDLANEEKLERRAGDVLTSVSAPANSKTLH